MKLQEKIKSWCKDEKFMSFAQERARKEVCEVAENHRIDPQYEELDEAFEYVSLYVLIVICIFFSLDKLNFRSVIDILLSS